MISVDDLTIESNAELLMFLPIFIFIGLCAPFLTAAYTLGMFQKLIGWLD